MELGPVGEREVFGNRVWGKEKKGITAYRDNSGEHVVYSLLVNTPSPWDEFEVKLTIVFEQSVGVRVVRFGDRKQGFMIFRHNQVTAIPDAFTDSGEYYSSPRDFWQNQSIQLDKFLRDLRI